MIGRNHANKFANQAGADLHLAQQEIVLTYALQLLVDRGVLADAPFKGGTYLRKMVLADAGRISEDLDLTNLGLPADPEARVRAAFAKPFHGIQFGIQEPYATRTG